MAVVASEDDLVRLVSDRLRSDRMLRFGYLLTGGESDAADLVQEALVRVLSRPNQGSGIDNLDAFIKQTMVRLQLNRSRRERLWRSVRQLLVIQQQQESSEDLVAYQDLVAKALSRLTPTQRAAFSLQFFDDYSVSEIARILNCSVGGAKRHLSDARRRLACDLSLHMKGPNR